MKKVKNLKVSNLALLKIPESRIVKKRRQKIKKIFCFLGSLNALVETILGPIG